MADIVIPYRPRDQFRTFHNRTERWAAMVCHRRAGRPSRPSTISSVACWSAAWRTPAPRMSVRRSFRPRTWRGVRQALPAPIPGVTFNESELRIDYPTGARLALWRRQLRSYAGPVLRLRRSGRIRRHEPGGVVRSHPAGLRIARAARRSSARLRAATPSSTCVSEPRRRRTGSSTA